MNDLMISHFFQNRVKERKKRQGKEKDGKAKKKGKILHLKDRMNAHVV